MSNKLWPKKKISWLFDVIGSGTTPSASNEMYYNSPDMAWLNTGDLTDSYIEKTSKYVSQQALDEISALTVFPKDSLVMAMYGATIGKLGITKYETTTNQACCVLSKPREVITKFIFYWLMGHRAEIINLSQGGGQPNISQGIIRDIRIAVPPVELQNKIVTFIDKKFEETNQLSQFHNCSF
ncbi:restriction endonuclease subunit S [Heyndrickxia sporothermodurans]|uniref:restriction endonuclease subunit S n=2 Tax=Heyndrickxia sporothermodurans TaxID=46224 RepID=UPI00192BD5C1|nr:restriction endonuclease subunit S [Heyndrickxia sporothermodurans]MBL5769009.1 restriction endonuclease subunit S [Heyndrickxia sporothermodurans]MBL5772796.1 restriction endonuclease subunit S [Heyndrickxia sporothermodurans]MBL5776264.1 restriction endonuclease subunit S [Heyndrickxia sporothermodurans]MBL5779815.1 restriction endonuclease subunit S [Heyndrickxia sporothermodurans]MBL5783384.1 restriction endonuclease subunit S [Heyndrickxia sporothermodurans]